MSYYRNYNSKEDIIKSFLNDIFHECVMTIEHENINIVNNTNTVFTFFQDHKVLLSNIINSKLTNLLYEQFIVYSKIIFENIEDEICYRNSVELKYLPQLVSATLCNILIQWVENDFQEFPDQLSKLMQIFSKS